MNDAQICLGYWLTYDTRAFQLKTAAHYYGMELLFVPG